MQLRDLLNTASQSRSEASLGASIEDGPETASVPPCECSREPVRGAFSSVTFGVFVRPGKSTIDRDGTMQPGLTPGLTQGVPGAPDGEHETAFSTVDKLASSPVDEPCSTSARQTDALSAVINVSGPRLDITGPGRGTAGQPTEEPSGAAPFTGSIVPTMNPTTPAKLSVVEPAKGARSADSVVNPAAGPGLASSSPASNFAENDPLTKPIKGPAVLGGPLTQNAQNPADLADMRAEGFSSAILPATGPGLTR